jgi:hypothetical protein
MLNANALRWAGCAQQQCAGSVRQALYGLGPNQGDVCDAHFCATFASMDQAWMTQS